MYIKSYSAVGIFIPIDSPYFSTIINKATEIIRQDNPNHEIEYLDYDLEDYFDIIYLTNVSGDIHVYYEFREDRHKQNEEHERGLLLPSNQRAHIVGGAYSNQDDAINDLNNSFEDVLPNEFPTKDYIAFVEYVICEL